MADSDNTLSMPDSREEAIASIGAMIERLVLDLESEGYRIHADYLGEGYYIGFPRPLPMDGALSRFNKALQIDPDLSRAILGYLIIHRPAPETLAS
ncbi:hypothetical protein [Aestuariivirga litoralis]|nr:hypothetical protein [Aestuariivirga litoralis]